MYLVNLLKQRMAYEAQQCAYLPVDTTSIAKNRA